MKLFIDEYESDSSKFWDQEKKIPKEKKLKEPDEARRKELTAAFYECFEEAGKQPSTSYINANCRFGVICYIREYGSWTSFLKTVGLEPLSRKITNEELDAEYDRVKDLLCRLPTRKDMETHAKYHIVNFGRGLGFKGYLMLRNARRRRKKGNS
jgi:hypothetical protein